MKNSKKTDLFLDIDNKLKKVEKESETLYDFDVAIDAMKSLDIKKKILWKQIYKNAVDDRSYALSLFSEVFQTMSKSAADHIAMSSTLTKYLEKMSKSNQQLLELSAAISKDEEESHEIDKEGLFNEIEDDDE
jgi:hypothetical protein